MRKKLPAVAGLALLAACTTDTASNPPAPASALMDQSVPQVSRDACLREVSRTTNNSNVTIIEMIYSEANSQVTVGVGPDRAKWRCLVSNSGVVAQVMSLTDEGAL
jgi:hypothetical protein